MVVLFSVLPKYPGSPRINSAMVSDQLLRLASQNGGYSRYTSRCHSRYVNFDSFELKKSYLSTGADD